MWETAFQQVLREQYALYLEKTGRASALRSFANQIDLSPSSTSELLSGKLSWHLRPSRAQLILDRLELLPEVRDRLLRLMSVDVQGGRSELRRADYDLLTNWVYPAVLFSYELGPEHRTVSGVATRLGLAEKTVWEITENLLSRGLIERDGEDKFKRTQAFWTTTDNIPDSVIEEHHRSNLDLAKQALDELTVDERDFTSLTFAGTSDGLATLKKEIRKLYELALALMRNSDTNTEVYRMSVQVFPIKSKNGDRP